jgi:hypothetical protein
MAAIDTNLVVLDVVARWRIDAALFLVTAAGFLGWSISQGRAGASVLAFAIECAVGVLLERWVGVLPGAARLGRADPLPAGAQRGSVLRCVVEGAGVMLTVAAVTGAIAVVLGDASFAGGWFAAYAIVYLTGAARARRIERRDRVELQVGVGSWRRHKPRYYVTSPVFRGAYRR